ncbi:LAME_0F15698g1_1 [Lachancea meyersii CBS 8951]|uniref:Mannosyltransferase n=1 Tax=Lachancea meyersii CBS 8951 TaxID=1266667 RepID=A0A1G4JYP6_9SACH|nr:LAME_0F15698g1_1 [Lachancea meyersii CBS 8951]
MRSLYTLLLVALLLVSRLYVQPFYSLISDCDETFNYWEPLNFLLRGFGKQTWEYSPDYSIRSWAFLMPLYAGLAPLGKIVTSLGLPPSTLFYLARAGLGLYSFSMEWLLFRELESSLSVKTANLWLFVQLFNPGWFHASVELLPSSFAMVTIIGFLKYFLRYLSSGSQSAFVQALVFNFVSGILGWPFVLILSTPLVVHFVVTHKIWATINAGFASLSKLVIVAVCVFGIDSAFYGKFTPVAWNIVMYNVIAADEKSGPNIFGVEPWYYYPLNLLLNFPLPTLMACTVGMVTNMRLASVWASLLIWMAVFLLQPHKEERFLYPIYAVITLAASVGLTNVWKRLPTWKHIRNLITFALYVFIAVQGSMRILALVTNYTAPLDVYANLPEVSGPQTICVGREWYHFPTSMFLAKDSRLGFIESGFDGLLPGDFKETHSILNSIREIPFGMNNQNQFDSSKLVSADQCDYYIDFMLRSEDPRDALDPTRLSEDWKCIYKIPFIDVSQSKFLGRAFAVPEKILAVLPLQNYWSRFYQANYLDYCIFEKQTEEA